MKFLLLMPLDETSTYMSSAIYQKLDKEVQDVTFDMPGFMQYLISTKIVDNWESALCLALLSAQKVYNAAGKRDLIILGNITKDFPMDAIFNVQALEEDLPYEDLFLNHFQMKAKDEEVLMKYVGNTYANEDSKMPLHNVDAIAHFIGNYLKSDIKPHDELQQN